MEEKKVFSPEQEDAIETRDRTLLVSAAAGSGKTTTLTERIIRSLLDEKKPESILNMLIVTFTNASVADLKEKVARALAEAAERNPDSKRLEKELSSLELAKIMTIDSFCAELIRQNAERLGINPAYRVAETAEALILERSVCEALIDSAFRGEIEGISPTGFEKLCDALTGVKNTSALADVFIALFEKTKSMVKGTDIFFDFANDYLQYSTKSLEETPHGQYIINEVKDMLVHFPRLASRYTDPLFLSDVKGAAELGEGMLEVIGRMTAIAENINTYDDICESLSTLDFPSAPRIKNPKPDEVVRAINFRQDVKTAIKKMRDGLLYYSREEWQCLYLELSRAVNQLAVFLDRFSKVYFEEKRKRACLEFSDIERLAYDALWQNGELTDVAKEYRELFTSVYIDEYQDVNELQNKIFEAVSPIDKRFMVGDIKQSIYGFRSARPEIFADMKKRFPPLDKNNYTVEAGIFMSNNYRCDKGVVDFVNDVFDALFGAVRDSIGYVDADKLKFEKKYKGFTPEYEKAKICIIEPSEKCEIEDEEEDDGRASLEAEFVAARIEELIKSGKRRDGSPIKAGDIAILMKTRKDFSLFEEALARRGIPSSAAEDKDFFMNKEILLTLSLLNSIDNPSRDIHLAALMCSPLYGFTADELYIIKRSGGMPTLYDSLTEYSKKHPEYEKAADFIRTLTYYRTLCEGMSASELLIRLYQETGLLSLASKQGGSENLYKLYSYAKRFEGSAYKGLYNFIAYVSNLIERGAKIDKNDSTANEGAVLIGTIHSSKGLEFPVVFLANAASTLTNLDTRQRIAFSEDFGISFMQRGPGGLALVENPLQKVIFGYMDKKFFEECIRLLYVALTRAKESLYVVGKLKNTTAEEYLERMAAEREALSAYSLKSLGSYLNMICAATENAELIIVRDDTSSETGEEETAEAKEEENAEISEDIVRELSERFTYSYPNSHLTALPEKMSVSRLYPTVLDGSEEGAEILFDDEGERKRSEPMPKFITASPSDESAKRGIATHNFLQFFDLDGLRKNGVKAELSRLTEKGFLSQKTASLVRESELVKFESSELYEAMRGAKALYREFRFNTRLPAELFTRDEEKEKLYKGHTVLVQGVIDCLIENEDGSLRLVDYKTDRLTKEELADEELAREKLSAAHSLQLSYYALAVEKIFGKRPERIEVYSLPLGKTVRAL